MEVPGTAIQSSTDGRDRRSRLRQLDRLLEALELLNLYDSREVPPEVGDRLQAEGIQFGPGIPLAELIEQVLDRQRPYLLRIPGQRWDLIDDDDFDS